MCYICSTARDWRKHNLDYKCQNDRSLSQHGNNDNLKSYFYNDGHFFSEFLKEMALFNTVANNK